MSFARCPFLFGVWAVLACTGCCTDGRKVCTRDGLALKICENGKWTKVECMRESGQLCEAGACVDPWRYGSPQWGRCQNEPMATPESLFEKMVYYEDIARRLHIHPRLKWITDVELSCLEVQCPVGQDPPCYDCSEPAVPQEQATYQDVERWRSHENDGLWSGLYVAAQAYRYAVTREPTALDNLKLLMEGERDRMRITSVPGLFTRQMIPPDLTGIECPQDLAAYVPSPGKNDNKWVSIGSNGCIRYVDGDSMQWVSSDRCGLDEFAGWCFLDNVSKDEYSGHMFALGMVAALVDDPEIQAVVQDLLSQVGHMLMDNQFELIDWDGRITEHGWLPAPVAVAGSSAAMALSFMEVCAEGTGDPVLREYMDTCLLMKDGPMDCFDLDIVSTDPWQTLLSDLLLYLGTDSCKSNWNNFSMHMLSLHTLLVYARDPELRARYARSLEQDVFKPEGVARPLIEQHNTFFNFIYAAGKPLGPGTDGPAYDVVEDGICMLRQFPARKHRPAVQCPPATCVLSDCTNRFDEPMTEFPRTPAERCPSLFLWWGCPYHTDECDENKRLIYPATDYLLAYWMGRYYGFIAEDM